MSSPAVQIRHRVPRIAQEAVERARLSVVPRTRTRAPKVPFVTLVSLLLVGGIVGLLLFNTSMQQASFAATALEKEATDLAARQQTLQMELDELRNPQRVATEAQQMGMVVPSAPTFITLGGGSVEGVKTPATAEDRLNLNPPAPVKPEVLAPAPTIVEVPATEVPAEAAPEPAKKQNRNGR
ncbi:hypothetical protein [Nocardioides sediminis]|uniref:hypothetical protein n=1 Tax=Nocardioides sediminis TaxID=433648 RepID=UPI000D3087AB|nr:hypothetical protein [Nocardioides sediminis]